MPTYCAAVHLIFDLLRKNAQRSRLFYETCTPIIICLVFLRLSLSSEEPVQNGRTDRQTGKTHNAAY